MSECHGTPWPKQTQNLKFKWLKLDSNPEPLSWYTETQPVWPNRWVFVYQLSGSRLECSCSHIYFYFFMFSNQVITESVFLHWFTDGFSQALLLKFSIKNLLTFPTSLLAGLISLHFGFDWKFSLWSLKVMNALTLQSNLLFHLYHIILWYFLLLYLLHWI